MKIKTALLIHVEKFSDDISLIITPGFCLVQILAAIRSASQMSGATAGTSDTGHFLLNALGDAFANTGRANAARILILVTDNQPSNTASMQVNTKRDLV